MATKIAVVSDVHANSTTAVCPPVVPLDDGGEYHSSKLQRVFYAWWLDYWKWVGQSCSNDDTLYIVFNGDLTEGFHHRSTQVNAGNPATQSLVVEALLETPLALNPDALFFVRGTSAHTGPASSSEESVAKRLLHAGHPVQAHPTLKTASWFYLPLEVEGVKFSFAHHGRMGQRPWTKRNITQLLAMQIYMEHITRGWRPPDVAVRSHFHTYDDTGKSRTCPTRLVATPAWQAHTEYAWKAVPEQVADVGGLLFTADNGRVELEDFILPPLEEPTWTPE